MQHALPPLLTAGHLLYRNLLLLSLPADDGYSLSPTLFASSSPPQHRALQHVLHHLLTALHSLPSPSSALSSSPLFLSLPSTLRHCFPCYDSTQQREFMQLCLDLLQLLEGSGLLPAGSVRRSFLQDGRGEKLERLLRLLSTLVLQQKLRAAGEDVGDAGRLQEGADVEQEIKQLQQRTMAAAATLRSELQAMAQEQDEWAEAADAMYAQWKDVNSQLRAAQEEEQRLSSSIDPFILSAAGEQRRAEMAADIAQQQQLLQDFMCGAEDDRGRLEAMATGDWKPTLVTAEQLQPSMPALSLPSETLSLRAVFRCWKDELCLLRDALQTEDERSEETVSLHAQLQQQTAQQQRLQQQTQRLTQQLQAELQHCAPPCPPSLNSTPLSAIFSLCSVSSLRETQLPGADTEDLTAEQPPLPSLAELPLEAEEQQDAADQADLNAVLDETAAGRTAENRKDAARLQHKAAFSQMLSAASADDEEAQSQALAGVASTPIKTAGSVHVASLLLSSPAYMGGGGLLDESGDLSELHTL